MAVPPINQGRALRAATDEIDAAANQQQAAQQAGNMLQLQQAVSAPTPTPSAGALGANRTGQQLAGQMTAAQGQTQLQSGAQRNQQVLEAAKGAIQTAAQQQGLALESQGLANDEEISQLQKQGQLRQNAAELDQAKRLEEQEIQANQFVSKMGMQYDNRLSFLTRKQREDLADLGRLTKQQLFDSRLQFEGDEQNRKFTNMRQLADYATASAESEEMMKSQLQEIQNAYKMEELILTAAETKINQQLELEFRRAESQKNQALMIELANKKAALQKKLARKKAQAAGTAAIIQGAFTVGGAVVGSIAPGAGTAAGASIGSGLGAAAAGAAQSQG